MFDLRVPQQNGSPSSCNGHRLNHEVPLPVKGLIHILQRLQWIHHDRHGIWHFATTPMTLPPMGPMGPMGPVAERHAESTSPKLLAQARRIISLSCQQATPDQPTMVMQNPEQCCALLFEFNGAMLQCQTRLIDGTKPPQLPHVCGTPVGPSSSPVLLFAKHCKKYIHK